MTDAKGHVGKRRENGMERVTNREEGRQEDGRPSTGGQEGVKQSVGDRREDPKDESRANVRGAVEVGCRGQSRAGRERQ